MVFLPAPSSPAYPPLIPTGPAIRISPRDVEIWEPELYHTIYKQKTSYRKDPVHYHSQGLTLSVATMLDPSEHRTRRALLNPMLSKRKVLEASDVILQGQIEKFVRISEGMAERNVPIPLSHGFYAITSDIMSVYLFGKSWNLMDEPGFVSFDATQIVGYSPLEAQRTAR
jgi:cytochrome P450